MVGKQTAPANLLGIVLCGGESKRMGSDKGLLKTQGKTWSEQVAEKLTQLKIPVVISLNAGQYASYSTLFPNTTLIIDKLSIKGPLNGLLSVHDTYPEKDLLLMACDMLDMQESTLEVLIRSREKMPGKDFYVYEHEGFLEPFCAIYTAKGMARVYQQFKQGQIQRFSLHDRFEKGDTLYIPVKNTSSFNNYNSL